MPVDVTDPGPRTRSYCPIAPRSRLICAPADPTWDSLTGVAKTVRAIVHPALDRTLRYPCDPQNVQRPSCRKLHHRPVAAQVRRQPVAEPMGGSSPNSSYHRSHSASTALRKRASRAQTALVLLVLFPQRFFLCSNRTRPRPLPRIVVVGPGCIRTSLRAQALVAITPAPF